MKKFKKFLVNFFTKNILIKLLAMALAVFAVIILNV